MTPVSGSNGERNSIGTWFMAPFSPMCTVAHELPQLVLFRCSLGTGKGGYEERIGSPSSTIW